MDLTHLKNKIKNFPLLQVSKLVQSDIQRDTKRRGWKRIENTIKHRVVNSKEHEIYLGGKDKDIAVYLHEGTRAHMVKPKDKKALHWSKGGKNFFSKGHRVSGIKPTHFFSIQTETRNKIKQISDKSFTA